MCKYLIVYVYWVGVPVFIVNVRWGSFKHFGLDMVHGVKQGDVVEFNSFIYILMENIGQEADPSIVKVRELVGR